MLKLQTSVASVDFRADLPAWFAPKGEAFIRIHAAPVGRINQSFMAARDALETARLIREKALQAISDPEKAAAQKEQNDLAFTRDWVAALYDTSVIRWETNLIDDDTKQPLPCTRDTFLALSEVRIDEITQTFLAFQNAVVKAGNDALQVSQDEVKN